MQHVSWNGPETLAFVVKNQSHSQLIPFAVEKQESQRPGSQVPCKACSLGLPWVTVLRLFSSVVRRVFKTPPYSFSIAAVTSDYHLSGLKITEVIPQFWMDTTGLTPRHQQAGISSGGFKGRSHCWLSLDSRGCVFRDSQPLLPSSKPVAQHLSPLRPVLPSRLSLTPSLLCPSYTAFCLQWVYLDHRVYSPPFKIFNSITSTKSLLSCKVTYSQVSGGPFFNLPLPLPAIFVTGRGGGEQALSVELGYDSALVKKVASSWLLKMKITWQINLSYSTEISLTLHYFK